MSFTQIKVYQKLIASLKASSRVGFHVIQNLRTLFVYHSVNGLLTTLGISSQPGGPPETGLAKIVGHVKMSVPFVELMGQTVDSVRVLCEDVASESKDEVRSGVCMHTHLHMHVCDHIYALIHVVFLICLDDPQF